LLQISITNEPHEQEQLPAGIQRSEKDPCRRRGNRDNNGKGRRTDDGTRAEITPRDFFIAANRFRRAVGHPDALNAASIAGDGPAPGVSIDASQIGGMHANRIVLVGTGAYLQVRVQQEQDWTLTGEVCRNLIV
jgi:hypothetical protein